MCWRIDKLAYCRDSKKYHKIADKNIIVYKIGYRVGNEFHPSFQTRFGYEPNVLKEEIKLSFVENSLYIDTWYEINKGYHSYSEDCSIVSFDSRGCTSYFAYKPFYVYNKGKATIRIGEYIGFIFIAEFIIPKGTEYYENEYGEIVSSQIMWTGQYVQPTTFNQWGNNLQAFKKLELCVGK